MYRLAMSNAWILIAPIVLVGIVVQILSPATARRMANMQGYSRKEKIVTVLASTLPYLFFVFLAFVPLKIGYDILYLGIFVYLVGLAGFAVSVIHFRRGGEGLKTEGIYSLTRNPIYVSVSLSFIGILLATYDLIVLFWLVLILASQHLMILAEERRCAQEYGEKYTNYQKRTPRYLFI